MPESSAGAGPRLPLRPVEPEYAATLKRAHGYRAAFDDLAEQLGRSGLKVASAQLAVNLLTASIFANSACAPRSTGSVICA